MAGIYVHIPFCKQKCTYCDFASYPKEIGKADLYFATLYAEMKYRAESLKNYVFDTVYIGGGTPSFVDKKYVFGAMKQLRNYYNISENAEITIEINPGTLTEDNFKTYKSLGINRFSVGLQSADDKQLESLNRIHTADDFVKAAKILRGENFSVDILLGLENQTEKDVKDSIDLAVENGAKHISAYALKPEEGTPIFGKYLNGDLPSQDEVADLYDFTVRYLKEKGYERYEISNFALNGFKSEHNLNYWKRGEYIGFGVSASSFIGDRRFTNTEKIDEYTACILRGKAAEIYSEDIVGDEAEFEYIMLALRTSDGIDLKDFSARFHSEFKEKYKDKLKGLTSYLSIDDERIKIKPEYVYVQSEIVIRFMD